MTELQSHSIRYYTQTQGTALEKLINQRIDYIEKASDEARRLIEKLMEGFPVEYAKKMELEQTAMQIKELKDRDLSDIKRLLAEKLSYADYESKHAVLLEKSEGWKTIEANISGRIWATAWILGILVPLVTALITIFMHVYWKT